MTAPTLAVVLALLAGQPQQASGVSGTVVTANDAVVAAAVVNVDQGGRRAQAVTNERGEFRLENVSLPATLEVTASGFASVRLSVASSPVRVQLAAAGIRESILVSGASPQDALRRPATGTTVLGTATLVAVPAVTLDETLRVIPGLSLFRRSSSRASNPTTHGVTMRGLSASGASRGLVLFDGVPLNDGFGGWVTWTRLPADALGGVSLRRGAEGDAYGSDALGGLVRVEAREIGPIAAGGEGGSQGTGAFTLSGGARAGLTRVFGAASWFSTAGSIPLEE